MGHFKGYFEGAKTFLTPKLSRAQRGTILGSKKSRPPRNIPRNGPLCSLPKTKKNNVPNFQNQRCIGIFMSLCDQSLFVNLFRSPGIDSNPLPIAASLILTAIFDTQRKPRENSSLGKNPLKDTTAYIVQQSNCRWHCERSCLLGQAETMKSLFTPCLFNLSISYLSIYNPSISKPSVSSPLSV